MSCALAALSLLGLPRTSHGAQAYVYAAASDEPATISVSQLPEVAEVDDPKKDKEYKAYLRQTRYRDRNKYFATRRDWISSDKEEDRGLDSWHAMATIHQKLDEEGSLERVYETQYLCDGPGSAGMILNPSWNTSIAREQIRRSRDVCESICGYMGLADGLENVERRVQELDARDCSTYPRLTSPKWYDSLASAEHRSSACINDPGSRLRHLYREGIAAGEGVAFRGYLERSQCTGKSSSESIAKSGAEPVIEAPGDESKLAAGSASGGLSAQ